MAPTIEILSAKRPSTSGLAVISNLRRALSLSGCRVKLTSTFEGGSDWLIVFGVGAVEHDRARRRHLAAGGRALLWDLGYIGREKGNGYMRFSIDSDHPQHLLSLIEPDPTRFDMLGVKIRHDFDPNGPIILVGQGRKSRVYRGNDDWETRTYRSLLARFPHKKIVYRSKKWIEDELRLPCEYAPDGPIEDVLRGASLVVCRGSNVAVDAVIAGVPYEAEDGAAVWLLSREFNDANRLDFLHRLAWLQWKPIEMAAAWYFIQRRLV